MWLFEAPESENVDANAMHQACFDSFHKNLNFCHFDRSLAACPSKCSLSKYHIVEL